MNIQKEEIKRKDLGYIYHPRTCYDIKLRIYIKLEELFAHYESNFFLNSFIHSNLLTVLEVNALR
jgi:hypothetical protein